jgi:hypothetical protein
MVLASPSRFSIAAKWTVAAALLFLAGCGGIGIGEDLAMGAVPTNTDRSNGGSNADAGSGSVGPDAGIGVYPPSAEPDAGPPFEGSPLCKVPTMMEGLLCDPDQVACIYASDAGMGGTCAGGPVSGSVCNSDSGANVELVACRVGATAPSCTPNYNANGTQNAACSQSSDCAIGFECIGATTSTPGSCKHYCCDGSCSGGTIADGPPPFCDIETAEVGAVPVCTTGIACAPLTPGVCGDGMTCTIVNADTGQTACVTVGEATAGSSCTQIKCAENLACIGGLASGGSQAVCVQLCLLDGTTPCPTGQTCTKPSALYASMDTGFGLCSSP